MFLFLSLDDVSVYPTGESLDGILQNNPLWFRFGASERREVQEESHQSLGMWTSMLAHVRIGVIRVPSMCDLKRRVYDVVFRAVASKKLGGTGVFFVSFVSNSFSNRSGNVSNTRTIMENKPYCCFGYVAHGLAVASIG